MLTGPYSAVMTMIVEPPALFGGELRCTIRCADCSAFTWVPVRESCVGYLARTETTFGRRYAEHAIGMTWDELGVVSTGAEVARAELAHDGCIHC